MKRQLRILWAYTIANVNALRPKYFGWWQVYDWADISGTKEVYREIGIINMRNTSQRIGRVIP